MALLPTCRWRLPGELPVSSSLPTCPANQDQLIEGMVIKAFPFLNKVAQPGGGSAGKLMLRIIETVLQDHPGFAPSVLIAVLRDLLERPAH